MKIRKTNFENLLIIESKAHFDERGVFIESLRQNILKDAINQSINFVQENIVRSKKNVFRGLHFQKTPYSQSKLVSVQNGKILDFVIDLREGSKTFGESYSINLSSDNNLSLFVPADFAHGYLTLEENTVVSYKVDNYYSPSHEEGIRYNDPSINIQLPVDSELLIISEKDKNFPDFKW